MTLSINREGYTGEGAAVHFHAFHGSGQRVASARTRLSLPCEGNIRRSDDDADLLPLSPGAKPYLRGAKSRSNHNPRPQPIWCLTIEERENRLPPTSCKTWGRTASICQSRPWRGRRASAGLGTLGSLRVEAALDLLWLKRILHAFNTRCVTAGTIYPDVNPHCCRRDEYGHRTLHRYSGFRSVRGTSGLLVRRSQGQRLLEGPAPRRGCLPRAWQPVHLQCEHAGLHLERGREQVRSEGELARSASRMSP